MADSRLAFDIVARGGSSAAAEFEKVAAASDHAGSAMKKNSKITTDAAKASAALTKAHNAESDALDKVQVAESRLSDVRQVAQSKVAQVKTAEKDLLAVRNQTSSSTSQIAAAESKLQSARASADSSTSRVLAGEKALAKARRDAAVAGNVAQKAAKDLGKILDNEGKKAGSGFGKSVLHWFTGAGKDVEKAGREAGSAGGQGFLSALTGVLKTPILGPIVIAGLVTAVAAAAVPVGAVVAGALVFGAGAGLSAIGLKFAAESAAVKSIWSKTASDLGAQMRTISKPFESTFAALSIVARRTFAGLKPELAAAFKTLAPAVSGFGDQLGQALQKLGPALQPLAGAFSKLLGSLGPAMNTALAGLSANLTKLSASISKSPTALADFTKGVFGLTGDLIGLVTDLNNTDAAFKRLTGTSAVTVFMDTVRVAVAGVIGPIDLLAKGFTALSNATKWAIDRQFPGQAKAGADAAAVEASSLAKAAAAHLAHANAAAHSAHETHAAKVAAYLLATAYDRQWAATQKANQALMQMSGLLLTLSGSEIAYQQAVDDVTAAIKANGKTHDITTQKGRDNQTALDQSAAAANAQTINLRNSNKAAVAVAIAAQREYAKQAVQMGYTAAEARRMAQQFVKIPPKVKTDFKVDITDLTAKIAAAKKTLSDPHLSATKKAKLQADIVQWQAGIAAAKRALDGLPTDKTARLLANKADLDAKLAAAKKQLANPALTATKKAKLEATIDQLTAAVSAAQAKINSLHGKTVTNSVITKYSSTGVNLQAPSAVGRRASGGPVAKGVPYVVGEKRPELFVPNQSGTILPKVPSMAVGQSVASGMAQGMLGGGGAAISAAGQVAAQMIAKAKDVLGIASPSKAFAQLGLYINQGFKIGLLGSAKQVQSVMSSLMSKVLNIAFNAADTRKSIQKTIATLNNQLAAARDRIKPIKAGMSKSEVSAAERNNRQVAASIRLIQDKLKSAKIDLANVNAIANRLGTTPKRNAVIAMIGRENTAMQKLANQRAAVATQLKNAQAKLAAAVQVRKDFGVQIADAALAFNSITNVTPSAGGGLVGSDILESMQNTLTKTREFAANLANLKKLGLRGDLYKQLAEAGVDQGGAAAAALLQGGKGTVNKANSLQGQIAAASNSLGVTAASNLYKAGVDAAQGLVNGLLAKTKALDAASKKLADAIVAQIKKTLGIHSPSRVMQWHGSMAGQGFAAGIVGEYGHVRRASAGLGDAVQVGARRTGPVRSGRPAASSSTTIVLRIETNGTSYAEFLARELRKYVQVNGGNVQKVLG